jgi:hypothetical protein
MLLNVMSMCNLRPDGATLQQMFGLARTASEIETLLSKTVPLLAEMAADGASRPEQRDSDRKHRGGGQLVGEHLVHAELAARARISDELAAGAMRRSGLTWPSAVEMACTMGRGRDGSHDGRKGRRDELFSLARWFTSGELLERLGQRRQPSALSARPPSASPIPP